MGESVRLALIALPQKLEWSATLRTQYFEEWVICPVCLARKSGVHKPGCELHVLICALDNDQ